MNESYCREQSKKLRKQFRIQRNDGEFLGSFASYGYYQELLSQSVKEVG